MAPFRKVFPENTCFSAFMLKYYVNRIMSTA